MTTATEQREFIRGHATMPLLPAALFFYFGWMQFVTEDSSLSDFYNFTVHLTNWTFRIGCFLYLAVAAGCYFGKVHALLADAAVTAWCALVFAVVGIDWSLYGFMNGYLFVIFAFMFAGSARRQFGTWRQLYRRSASPPINPPAARIMHPAEIHPDVLPKADEPPPAEGYLAALAREKRDAPRADHE